MSDSPGGLKHVILQEKLSYTYFSPKEAVLLGTVYGR